MEVATSQASGADPFGLKAHIRAIPDFPKPGILFYDVSTLLRHPAAWRSTVEALADLIAPFRPDRLIGIESRGFLVAAPPRLSPRHRFRDGAQAREAAG